MKYEDADIALKSRVYGFGEFRLEATNLSLFRNSEVVSLAPKACEVLLVLVESGNKIVKKEEILERVWADTFVEEANLTHHISALRKALGEDKTGRRFIETIPRRGYRFVHAVKEIKPAAPEIIVSEQTRTRITEEVVIEPCEPQPLENVNQAKLILPPDSAKKGQRRWHSAALAGTIAVVAFAAVGYALYQFAHPSPMIFEAKKTTRITATGKVKLAAIAPDGKLIAYAQEENNEQQSLWIRHITSESSIQIAPSSQVEYRGLNISPDGNWLYYVVEQGSLHKMPVLGGTTLKIADGLFSSAAGNVAVGVSPDNKQVAFVRRFKQQASALFIVNADGTNERTLAAFEQPIRLGASVAWSPDGKVVACRMIDNGRQNALAVQVTNGTSAPVLPQDVSNLQQMAWMSDSKSLLTIDVFGQINQIYYPSGEVRNISSDAYFRQGIGLTSDGSFLATVKTEQTAYIWTMPSDDASRARQLTAGFEKQDGVFGLNWLPGGGIIYDSNQNKEGGIQLIDVSGGNPKQIAKDHSFDTASPDGRFVVYQKGSAATGDLGLYQMDVSNGHETRLTSGSDNWQTFSPDGKWLVFTRFAERVGLWKVLGTGGEATLILDENAICPAVSPDGKTIAFVWRRVGKPVSIALVSIDGGEIIKTFDAKLERNSLFDKQNLQWTRDGRGIYFIALSDNVSNIWQQPIDGSEPVQVTNFKDGRIFNFAFSPDGSQLALSRGTLNSDVVLIENTR